jgi:hypothetical protein
MKWWIAIALLFAVTALDEAEKSRRLAASAEARVADLERMLRR